MRVESVNGAGMDAALLEEVRAVWRARLGAPDAFREPGVHLHARVSAAGWDRWVAAVALADAVCVTLPGTVARHLARVRVREHGPDGVARGVDADRARDLTGDPTRVDAAAPLDGLLGPVAETIGPSLLLFLDPRLADGQVPPAPAITVTAGDHAAAARLAAACPARDREESGILGITSVPWVWRERGRSGRRRVVAACGYEVWEGRLAQLCVLVHPAHRGQGKGRAVAAAAVRAAVAEGLIPQWRVRSTLQPSRRIAAALGFVQLGWQALYRLEQR